jgi:lipoprotein-anchoring transpeptidase ErfK/SrfK
VRRAGFFSFLLTCAAAGGLAAAALPALGPASTGTTHPTTTTTGTTSTTGTTATTGTTSTTGTTGTTAQPRIIAPNVRIGGIAVGGLNAAAAVTVVRVGFASPLVLRFQRYTLTPSPRELGATAQVETAVARALTAPPGTNVRLTVRIRLSRVRVYVASVAKRFDRAPVDSKLILRRMRPWISKPTSGRAIDRRAAERAIVADLRATRRLPIALVAKPVPARVTRESFGPIIVIKRGSNALHLYDGMRLRRTFPVATGERRYPTPLGRFQIVVKWKNPWWYPPDSDWAKDEKPIPPGPDNPLGTRWMGISSPGVGIHGTPNPGSIGYSVSHGCIRMRIPDAEWLFEQVSIGTPVFIVAA